MPIVMLENVHYIKNLNVQALKKEYNGCKEAFNMVSQALEDLNKHEKKNKLIV